MKNKISEKNKYYLIAFLLGACVFVLSFLPFIIKNGMVFYFYGDFNSQQIPFTIYLQQQLRNAELPQFDFYAGTGLDFIEAYGFYNLFSPFMLPLLLIPTEWVVYAIPFVIALKFGFCSMFAYMYASRFCNNKDYALAAGLLYAFSGYQMVNFIFHYLDALVFFPLLLTALEMAVTEKKRVLFGITVLLCAFTNYYVFGIEVVFLILYFLFRLSDKSFRINFRDFLCLAAESVLGVLAAGFVLLPAISAIMASPRYGTGFSDVSDMLVYETPWRYARILQAIFLPPDTQGNTNFFPDFKGAYPHGSRWSSQAMYIPLFGMSGVIAYAIAEKKSWMTRLSAACIVMAFVPVLNSLFSLGSAVYYARWMFAPTLIMSVMTAAALENEPKLFKSGLILNGAMILAIAIFSILFPMEKLALWQSGAYYNTAQRVVQIIVGAAGLIIAAVLLFKAVRDTTYSKKVVVAVTAFVFAFSEATLLFGMGDTSEPLTTISAYTNYPEIERTEYGKRLSADDAFDNSNLFNGYGSVYSFNSTVNPNISDYCDAIGDSLGSYYELYETECLCSVKEYIFARCLPEDANIPLSGDYAFLSSNPYCTVYENRNFIPIGFCYDYFITKETLMSLDTEIRAEIMLRAMVLDEADSADGYLEEADKNMLYDLSDEEFAEECALRAEDSAKSFRTDGDSCTAVITVERPELVFFSIAYDEDFTAYVDGRETEIIKANVGFMAVPVNEGTHTVELVYHSEIRKIGLAASAVGIIGLCIYAFVFAVKKSR